MHACQLHVLALRLVSRFTFQTTSFALVNTEDAS